jgi:hypothetical protein
MTKPLIGYALWLNGGVLSDRGLSLSLGPQVPLRDRAKNPWQHDSLWKTGPSRRGLWPKPFIESSTSSTVYKATAELQLDHEALERRGGAVLAGIAADASSGPYPDIDHSRR